MSGLLRFITSAKTSWIPLVLAAVAAGALFAFAGGDETETAPSVGLPASAESERAQQLLDEFPSADGTSAILVFASDAGDLSDAQLETIGENAFGGLADLSADGFVPPAQVSSGSVGVYVLIVGGGLGIIGLLVPALFYLLRKPSWKDPEAAAIAAPAVTGCGAA